MSSRRRHYRKNLRQTGCLLRDDGELPFAVLNLSTHGLHACFAQNPLLIVGREERIRLPELKLEGRVVPVRSRPAEDSGYDVGFEFVSLDGTDGNAYRYRADESTPAPDAIAP